MINAEHHAGALVLAVTDQRIDAAVAVPFKDAVQAEAAGSDAARVVLDLTAVAFVDSSGLGAIVGAMKQLGEGRRMELAGLQPMVRKVFSLTRMDRVFRIHDDVDAALAEDGDGGIARAS